MVSVSSQKIENRPTALTHKLFFTVKDTGRGIAAHELERLFVPFEQTTAGRESRQGTGLGLSISQQYCHLMGGAISVESVASEGSAFKLVIPIEQRELEQRKLEKRKPEQRKLSISQGLESSQESYPITDCSPGTTPAEENSSEADIDSLLAQLRLMPADWLNELYKMATQIKGKQVLRLIEQLPLVQTDVAQQLRYWAKNYQFEKIVEILDRRSD